MTGTPLQDKNSTSGSSGHEADMLLQALVWLSRHHGTARSSHSLVAGLAYDVSGMSPSLFVEAAGRIGLNSKTIKRPRLRDIPTAVLPAILMMKDKSAVILLSVSSGMADVADPLTGARQSLDISELQAGYSGFSIYVQKAAGKTVDALSGERHWFWSLIEDCRSFYGLVLLGAVFINLFALVSPLFIMNVYDRVIPNNAIETGWVLGIGALGVFVFDFIMRTLRAHLIDTAGRRVDVIAARRIYDQVLNMRLAARPGSSGVFANMLRDFDSVRDFFTSATITALVDLPFAVFFLFVIYQIGGAIAFALAGLIVLVIITGFLIQFRLKKNVLKSIRSAEKKHGLLVETIHGLETVKAVNADGRFRARYTDYAAENARHTQASRFWSGLGVNIATFLQQIAAILVVLIGMYMVRDAELSVGGLIACVLLGGRAIAPIGQIANLMSRYHQAGGALKTIDKIMRQPVERPAGQNFLHRPVLQGKLVFDQVSFSYPNVNRKILDRVSFVIEPGERVGIIGRIGSGKSTVARLMMGLYEPDEGTVFVDDTDYRQIDPADLRRNIAYIAQDVVLFSGTVRDNIVAGVPGADEKDILAVAQDSGVHEFISRHPMGYDAPVGEGGFGLSGGQRQAIALARAMILNPRALICDEPTNSMDVQAEQSFKNYMREQSARRTLVLITHRQTMLSLVDRLIVMDNGCVMKDGPRDQVLAALHDGKIGSAP